MIKLGLKSDCSPEQLENRLKLPFECYEFHLWFRDLETSEGLENLEQKIQLLQEKGCTNLVLHQPIKNSLNFVQIAVVCPNDKQNYLDFMYSTEQLAYLARKYDVRCLIHSSYNTPEMTDDDNDLNNIYNSNQTYFDVMIERYKYFNTISGGRLMLENSTNTSIFYGDRFVENKLIEAVPDINLCYDISHAFISINKYLTNYDKERANDLLIESLRNLKDNIVHYHVVDSLGEFHDSLKVGDGLIDWKRVLSELNPNATMIFECYEQDITIPENEQASYDYLVKLEKELED